MTTKTYLFLDHDSRDSRTLFYLSFKRPKSKPNLRQTGLKTIPFGPNHGGSNGSDPSAGTRSGANRLQVAGVEGHLIHVSIAGDFWKLT